MNDEMEIFFNKDDGSTYLESLIRSRCMMYNSKNINLDIVSGLEEVISLEIELARLGAEKAMSEAKKATAKVTPLKGV